MEGPAAGRGRGRGRGGGIAVLPEVCSLQQITSITYICIGDQCCTLCLMCVAQGMWEGLNRKTEPERGGHDEPRDRDDREEGSPVDYDDVMMPPAAFGSRGGR